MAAEWISDPTIRTQTNEGPGAIPGLFPYPRRCQAEVDGAGFRVGSLHRVYDVVIDRRADLQRNAHSRFDRAFDPTMLGGGVLPTIVNQALRSPHIPEQLGQLV